MKVFLSWSGEQSKAAATALHGWLPTVIQTVRPYMSAENIDKGDRWSIDISKQLEETHFGIICMTPQNREAPWVLFEAGALSKSMEKGRVSPLLFGIGPSDLTGSPLLQFQSTLFKKEDFKKLLHSVNAHAPETERLNAEVLNRSFERAWDELDQEIARIEFASHKRGAKPEPKKDVAKTDQILEELLGLARSQMKVLRSPEDILPVPYLTRSLQRALVARRLSVPGDHPLWRSLLRNLERAASMTEDVQKHLLSKESAELLQGVSARLRGSRKNVSRLREILYDERRMYDQRSLYDEVGRVVALPPQTAAWTAAEGRMVVEQESAPLLEEELEEEKDDDASR